MTARTTVESVTGTLFAISAGLPATYDATGYAALTYTTVGEVEDIGSEDATKATQQFTPIATSVVTKVPGPIDYGKRTVVLGHLPSDAGQVLMKAAFKSNNRYSVKITFPDTEVRYYDVLVTKFGTSGGKAGELARVTSEIDICREPIVVLPA